MRILMNSEHLRPNTGISVQTLQVARALAGRGHEIHLLYMRDGPYRDAYAEFCASMRRVPAFDLGVRHVARDAPKLLPAVVAGAGKRPDVVYVNRYRPLPWALATAATVRAAVVCHLHGLIGIEHARVNRALSRRTDELLAVSGFVRDRFVENGGSAERTTVVHNGVDPGDYPFGGPAERAAARAALGLDPDAEVVAFVGRVDPSKGLDVLADAVAALAAGGRERISLLVVGPTGDEALAARLAAHPVAERTTRVDITQDVVTPMHASDVVVLPSIVEEAFGRTVVEAMATGRPAVATAVGGVPEVLGGGFARFLAAPGDAGSLAAALERAIDWRTREPGLGGECRRHVSERFSLAAMVDSVEDALERAARRGR